MQLTIGHFIKAFLFQNMQIKMNATRYFFTVMVFAVSVFSFVNSSALAAPSLDFLSIGMSPATIDACNDSTQLTIVMGNTGPDDAYNVDLAITLPSGITYNTGTAESGLGTDDTVATAGVADPAISGSTITFYDFGDKSSNIANVIQAAGGNDTLVLRFTVQSACYITDNLDFDLRYYDSSDVTQYSETTQQELTALYPSLTVTKTPTDSQVGCGNQQNWTITVTNNGSGNAQVVRVEDTPGAWIDVRTGQPGDPIDMGGGVYGWEVNNIAPNGGNTTFTLVGTLNPDGLPNQADCTAALRQNNVSTIWACGTAGDAMDNDPTTISDYDCEDSSAANAPVVTLRLPNLVVTDITPDIGCTSDGNFTGSITVTVQNQGDGASTPNFTVQVTDGKGWTGTGTHSGTISAGNSVNVTITTGTWAPDCQPCAAPYSFDATVDLNSDVCECDESDNDYGPETYTAPIPDLAVDSDTLSVVCFDDGQVTVTGMVALANNGCNTGITSNIPMRFTLYDNTGCGSSVVEQWTDTFSSVNIAAGGGTQAFVISNHTLTSNQCLDSTGCQVSMFVEADYNNSVCECDGTNNTYCADNKTVYIPDIEVGSDTLTLTCLDDGQVTVSGAVTLTNNGCGSNLNSNIPMRFTLYDNTGCAGSQLDQWTQTFAGGGTQVFAITPRIVTSDLVTNSTGCQVSIRVEADYNDSVCECDGTDNTYCADNKNIDIPNLQVSSDTLGITCLDDGQFTISGTVTMLNNGCGSNLNSNIPVRFTIYDNTGCAGRQVAQWTETLAGVNIPALGGTQVFAITPQNITSDPCANSTGCQVSIRIEADYTDTVCESDGTDNVLCSNKALNIPNLVVNNIETDVACAGDGNLTGITVDVSNNGCADAGSVVVRLTSDCGLTFTDQTVNLAAGETKGVFFPFAAGITDCNCNFTAVIDPDNTLCECNNTDNTATSPSPLLIPDVEVQSDALMLSCSGDGHVTVSGTVTLVNNGCGPNLTQDVPMRFTLYGGTGCNGNQADQWMQAFNGVNIPSGGGTQTFTIQNHGITTSPCANSANCQASIFVEADYSQSTCEWDGTDNTYCADGKDIDLPDLLVRKVDILLLENGDNPEGLVSAEVANIGSSDANGVTVRLVSSCYATFSDQTTDLFAGSNKILTFVFDSSMLSCDCTFTVIIDPDFAICEYSGQNNEFTAKHECTFVQDLDGDGIADEGEQGPNRDNPAYDGNSDGAADWRQCNVASFHSFAEDGGHYLTIEAPSAQCFLEVLAIRPSPPLPPRISMPFGYFSFRIAGLDEGACTYLTLYLDREAPQTYYKYGPTPDNLTDHWYEFSFDGQTGAEFIDETTMVLRLCDGQRGDHDLTVDGEILDPGGPAAIEAHAELYFPSIANEGGAFAALGIINKESYDVSGTINYYGADGSLLESNTVTLLGRGKREIVSGELPPEAASAIVYADGNLVGFGRFLSLGGKCYALPSATRLGHLITIPFAHTSSNWRTGIGLFNPSDKDATVTIADSSDITTDIPLTAKGQHFFWVEATESPHRITANANIAAMEIIESLTSGGDIAGILLGTANSTELYVPAVSFGGSDFTGIGICNSTYNSCSVTAYGYDAGGAETEVSLGLMAGESKMSANLSNRYAADTLWVKITDVATDMSTPFGNVSLPLQVLAAYGEDGTEKMGAVSLSTLKFEAGIVGVVESEVIPTLTLMNPNNTSATVTVTVYDADGTVGTTDQLTIPAGGNMTSLVDSLVGGITLHSGDYMLIESDIEIYGFETIYAGGRMEILPILK